MGKLEGKRILLVDDELILREILAEELVLEGGFVLQASNGKEAFDILKKESVSAVISDVQMLSF